MFLGIPRMAEYPLCLIGMSETAMFREFPADPAGAGVAKFAITGINLVERRPLGTSQSR